MLFMFLYGIILTLYSLIISNMSFLYDKRTKKAIKWVWVVIAAIIAFSMIFAYSGGASLF